MRCLLLFSLVLSSGITVAQSASSISPTLAKQYFAEADALCHADGGRLWGVSLCGPMLFVDPQSRAIVANAPDAGGVLHAEDGVYTGTLPADQNVANTAMMWSGTHWTEVLWPLPEDGSERAVLITHELFHRVQDRLGFSADGNGDNAQLDTLDGRYLLQLEWRALAKALTADTDEARRQAAADALLFRAERYRLFPAAAAQERALERNEGLAEYTGVRLGNLTPALQRQAALKDLSRGADASTFVRSFPYATGPAYGLLLDQYDPAWRTQLKTSPGMDTLLRKALASQGTEETQSLVATRAASYDGPALYAAETTRETSRQQLLAEDRRLFLTGPVLTLTFQHMQVQFDPRNLQPLGDAGTVYPTMRISDAWGVLEAREGALMKPDWSAVVVVAPHEAAGSHLAGSHLSGPGWTLDLKPGWVVQPGARKGDLLLRPGV